MGNGSSYKAADWAWDQQISATEKLVLVYLAARVDQSFSCYPKMSTIAEATGLGRSTVARIIGTLEAKDLLLRATRKHKNGVYRSSRYFLNHPIAGHVTGEMDPDDSPELIEELNRAARRAIEGE